MGCGTTARAGVKAQVTITIGSYIGQSIAFEGDFSDRCMDPNGTQFPTNRAITFHPLFGFSLEGPMDVSAMAFSLHCPPLLFDTFKRLTLKWAYTTRTQSMHNPYTEILGSLKG